MSNIVSKYCFDYVHQSNVIITFNYFLIAFLTNVLNWAREVIKTSVKHLSTHCKMTGALLDMKTVS